MAQSHLSILAALALACATGCATKRDVVSSKLKGEGTGRAYAVTTDQAWAISRTILHLEALDPIEEHRTEGYMLTSDGTSALSPGTYIGVFVEPEGSASTKVTFVTRRRTPTQAYPALGAAAFHRKFVDLLSLIDTVRPIDASSASPTASPACAKALDAGASEAKSPVGDEAKSPVGDGGS